MLVNDLYSQVCADVPLPPGSELFSGDDAERDRLAVVLATCRALGVFYHQGETTNAPVDTGGSLSEALMSATADRNQAAQQPSNRCAFCERKECDNDCYHCDSHREENGARSRLTAAQHRVIGGADDPGTYP